MVINEIYISIQGESTHIGIPMVFVRLTYCNLRCSWCDTAYAFNEGTEMSLEEIIDKIESLGLKIVEITGGEPLVQKDTPLLIGKLLDLNYTILVETSGSLDINMIPEGAIRIMDIKCPSSGELDKNDWDNISRLKPADEVKFVIENREDFDWAKNIVSKYNLSKITEVLFSPVFDKLPSKDLVKWILKDRLPVRFQPQLHKYIWGPDKRNV